MLRSYLNRSLQNKIVSFGIIISLISILLTTVTCYYTSNKLILDQFEHVNKIATSAAQEKTNTYLGEIAQIINLSMKNEYFDTILYSDNSDSYQQIKAQKDYETYLKSLILNNDKIDALLVVNKKPDFFFSAANTVDRNFDKYESMEFYTRIQRYLSNKTGYQFFLDRYTENNSEKIAVICPILESYSDDMQAYIVAVLSTKLSKDLQFAGDRIYITDSVGNDATVVDSRNLTELADEKYTFKNKLNFEGWNISSTFTFAKIDKALKENLMLNIKIGMTLFLVSLILLIRFSKKLVDPIKSMEAQISHLNHSAIENKPIVFARRRISFKIALFLLYSVIVILPVLLITGSTYISSKDTFESKIGSVFEYSANILFQQLGFTFNNCNKAAIEISTVNSNIQKYMNQPRTPEIKGRLQDELNNIILSNKLFSEGIANISIYDNNFELLCSSIYGKPFMTRPSIKEDLDYVNNHFGNPLWRDYSEIYFHTSCFRVGMQIRGVADGIESGKLMGYILIDFATDDIQRMINSFQQYGDVQVYLMNASGQYVLKNDEGDESSEMLLKDGKALSSRLNRERVSFNKQGDNYLMVFKNFIENQWQLVFLLKNFNESRKILVYSILELIGMLVLCFAFSYGFSTILSFNISRLVKTVKKVKGGNLKERFESIAVDEIGELGNSFNEMLERLNELIDEKYLSEVKMKDAQIKAKEYELNLLQAQINPHFLYNTLKTAQYMVFAKDPRAERMIKLLITLFKTGITKGEKLVKVETEIEHIKTYIDIQQMRFSDKFNVNYDISEDVRDLLVLKLTLQPLVENAIYHGLELYEDKGTLYIEACRTGDRVKFTIRDDGMGMSEDKLLQIKDQLAGKIEGKSIGLLNVHERIRLHFGEQFGLEVESAKWMGTTVTAWFPVITE